jgi:endonuclease/exonuclease/phosphatase family metal-dependent hydrolase
VTLVLASYNIHRCYGRDGRHDPERIRQVLHNLDAHVVALQEVELLYDSPGLLEFFCENTAWKAIPGLTLTRDNGHYGNALLTSLPIHSVRRIDLSQPGREPRGALHVMLEHHGFRFTVTATHLGLRPGERRAQIGRLLEIMRNSDTSSKDADARVLMGDLNEWLRWARARRWLRQYFTDVRTPASYPAFFPLLPLDRILVDPVELLRSVEVVKSGLARTASDHLPVVARLDVGAVRNP